MKNTRLEEKKTLRENVRLFRIKYPKIDMVMDIIGTIADRICLSYWITFIIIICLIGAMSILMLPDEIREWALPIITTVFSVMVAPLLIKIYGQNKENKIKRFERNYELYVELIEIIVPLVIDKNNKKNYKKRLEKVIQDNYSHIYLNFSSVLFYDLMSLHISCENMNENNIKYFAHKCIRNIRKESENNKEINISYEMIKILES